MCGTYAIAVETKGGDNKEVLRLRSGCGDQGAKQKECVELSQRLWRARGRRKRNALRLRRAGGIWALSARRAVVLHARRAGVRKQGGDTRASQRLCRRGEARAEYTAN